MDKALQKCQTLDEIYIAWQNVMLTNGIVSPFWFGKEALKHVRNLALEEAVQAIQQCSRYDGPFTDYGDHAEDGYSNGLDDASASCRALKNTPTNRITNEE